MFGDSGAPPAEPASMEVEEAQDSTIVAARDIESQAGSTCSSSVVACSIIRLSNPCLPDKYLCGVAAEYAPPSSANGPPPPPVQAAEAVAPQPLWFDLTYPGEGDGAFTLVTKDGLDMNAVRKHVVTAVGVDSSAPPVRGNGHKYAQWLGRVLLRASKQSPEVEQWREKVLTLARGRCSRSAP